MINEELIEKNYELFKKKVADFGVEPEAIDALFGDKLKNASYSTSNDYGLAYEGSLLQVILRTFTPIALKVMELVKERVNITKGEEADVLPEIEQASVVKICLLHQISKAVMFEKNDDKWQVEKRGLVYKFAESEVGFKTGMRSLFLCHKLGIDFTEAEFEAMTILDKAPDDMQAKYYCSPLSAIIREANELTYLTTTIAAK